jgi:hypothetical protein
MFSLNSKNGIFSKFRNKIVVIPMEINDDDKTNTNNLLLKLKNFKFDADMNF